ncbi:hypothetical protein BDK51DRAFT_33376, partial [Blyttiomyces helicus]
MTVDTEAIRAISSTSELIHENETILETSRASCLSRLEGSDATLIDGVRPVLDAVDADGRGAIQTIEYFGVESHLSTNIASDSPRLIITPIHIPLRLRIPTAWVLGSAHKWRGVRYLVTLLRLPPTTPSPAKYGFGFLRSIVETPQEDGFRLPRHYRFFCPPALVFIDFAIGQICWTAAQLRTERDVPSDRSELQRPKPPSLVTERRHPYSATLLSDPFRCCAGVKKYCHGAGAPPCKTVFANDRAGRVGAGSLGGGEGVARGEGSPVRRGRREDRLERKRGGGKRQSAGFHKQPPLLWRLFYMPGSWNPSQKNATPTAPFDH